MTELLTQPRIRVVWLRGEQETNFGRRPSTFFSLGTRGSGKSSLLEAIAARYPKVIDIFGSKDSECLSWCKPESPFKDILFIKGRNIRIASNWPSVCVDKLTMQDFEQHQVITTTYAFYNTTHEYFEGLQKITTLLWDQRTFWSDAWFILIREAANMIYARLQIVKDSDAAKADFLQMLREARHSGLAVGVDTIRWTNIDKEVRDVADYTFIKKTGAIGLPKDLRFIYKYVQPNSLMKMEPQNFVLLTIEGNLCMGKCDYPSWHKEEKENIIGNLGIEIEHLSEVEKDQSYNVGLLEHVKIMEKYKETMSMGKTAAQLKRSNATIFAQVKLHNENIKESGYCLECHKSSSPLEKETLIKKGRVTRDNTPY